VFRTLSPEGGFYYDGVKAIQQDSEGFVWVLMDNDLYRFDGYRYKRYGAAFRAIDKAGQWDYYNVTADTGGRILVGTNKGVYAYERERDCFVEVFARSCGAVRVDRYNNMWVKEENRFCLIHADSLFVPRCEGKALPYVGRVTCDYNGEFYVVSSYGKIYRYDYAAMEFLHCATLPGGNYVVQARTAGDKMWALLFSGELCGVDMASYAVEKRISVFSDGSGNVPRDLYIDRSGMLWVASSGGLYIVDPATQKASLHVHDPKRPFSIPNSSVWCIAGDNRHNVWLGTYAGGLCYVNIGESHPFSTYLPGEGGLNHSPVSGFAESGGYLWISTEGGGCNRMDRAAEKFACLRSGHGDRALASDNVKAMADGGDGKLWIATYIGGLDLYDTRTGKVRNFRHEAGYGSSLLYNNLRTIAADTAAGGLWIAYQATDVTVSFLSFKDYSVEHYCLDSANRRQYIFDMALDRSGSLWVVSHSSLYRMDVKTRRCTRVAFDTARYLYAQSVCCDKKGTVWVGTIGNGLYRYNPADGSHSVFRGGDHFNLLSIYSLCSDNEGNIWMGTDNGLFCYNVRSDACSRFDKKDGVQGQVYYPLAAFKDSEGKLYFGGTNGFTVVEPRRLTFNTCKPKVIISDCFIDNKPVRMNFEKTRDSHHEGTVGEVTLSHRQANFGFRFSSDNYFIPEKNMFRYRLLGYDDRWITIDAANRTVFYSQVPPGTYYLEVAAANNDGLWSDTPTVIKIRRKAAPWFSLAAYFAYALVAAAVIFFLLYYYNGRKKLRMQLYLEGIEKDKKEQIHQSQLRFFTNISHDFRTPLSLISAVLNRVREKNHIDEYCYGILSSNTNRLLNLVNELMDFRTIENGMMRFEPKPCDVVGMAQAIAADFAEYARQRDVAFEVVVDPAMPKALYADRNILEKVVINLLHNAFKYTRDGGAISLELFADAAGFVPQYSNAFSVSADAVAAQNFCIAVRDTGVGIAGEDMPSVFERFYKVSTAQADANLGTGIGLALVKSLVLLHRGTIAIHSELECGTDMAVCLASTKDFYEKLGLLAQDEASAGGRVKSLDEDVAQKLEESIPCAATDRKKVLLVEDNAPLRSLIADSLADARYAVVEAANGQEAFDLLQNQEIDLVISDILMPVKDGITLCREVKSSAETSYIPFILLTAKTGVESKLQGADSGADLYFEKPVDLGLLRMSVQNMFRQQQRLRERYADGLYVGATERTGGGRDDAFLKSFVDVLEKNLSATSVDMDFIASELSMSHTKFYNKVKKITGKSPVEFINSYRMRKAARLIAEGAMTTSEIMFAIGISSNAYYTNAFKREFGMTPTAFAAKYRKKAGKI
ncbi:MAG: response regulator, partial [Prevotellaceae bacterium]|jgi:signal transduction histidine kinase/DNA-binding response OmpR family regulator/ligand-binding sensor domain-containing protein|nr:response regulator [Prevotellaceae bacterium]